MIDQWYEQFALEITRFIRSKGFGLEDAEDICAQVFMEAVQRQPEDIAPRAWLYQVANSRIIDRWRADKRHATQALQDYDAVVSSCELSVQHVESVRSELASLPPLQRRVLELRFVQDLTVSETAEAIGRSIGAVKALQHRAQATLRHVPQNYVSPQAAREVWAAITARSDASMRQLSAQTGLSSATVKRSLDMLRAAGYVEFEDGEARARRVIVPRGDCVVVPRGHCHG